MNRRLLSLSARIALVWTSVALVLLVLEIALRSLPSLQELDSATPIYIPTRLRAFDRAINAEHRTVAERHRFGFNDVDRSPEKGAGVFRLVVLGDSFVWGDGVREEDRWSRKLESALRSRFDNVEVLHWGQNGWSTLDQMRFLEEQVDDWSIDAMLIGFVSNDPDMEESLRFTLPFKEVMTVLGYRFLFPEASAWITGYLGNVINPHIGAGYNAWKERLYEAENLERWTTLLTLLNALLDGSKIPYVFVMTPNNGHPSFNPFYAAATTAFETVGSPYLDLLPHVRSQFGTERSRRLWANPANPHPGSPVTTLYSQVVTQHLDRTCSSEGRRLVGCRFE